MGDSAETVTLLLPPGEEQVWVHDGESRVKAVAQKAGVKLAGFARFHLRQQS